MRELKRSGVKDFRAHRKCQCPIWAQGTLRGQWMKKSLDLRNWEAAQKLIREWESGAGHKTIPVKEACDRFLEDCKARHLRPPTIAKYNLLVKELKEEFGNRTVAGITVDELRAYREGWELGAISAGKKLERLRSFFRFCMDSEWCGRNPAQGIKAPIAATLPTLPLTKDDFDKIVWACELFPANGIYRKGNRIRVRAFVLLLRYSGLRIRDAVLLTEDKLVGNKLLLYSAKTGVPVHIPLPEEVVKQLAWAYELSPGKYFFWSGAGEVKSCVNDWQRTLSRLSELSGVRFHAHMLRDTFAVELLQKGVSLENVAVLLGNTIKIAEKHYSPWVKSRQESLTAEIEKAWKL